MPPIYIDIIKYPWYHFSYEELRKYIKIEFSLRQRNVDENGVYTGYTHGEKYPARDCRDDEIPSYLKMDSAR